MYDADRSDRRRRAREGQRRSARRRRQAALLVVLGAVIAAVALGLELSGGGGGGHAAPTAGADGGGTAGSARARHARSSSAAAQTAEMRRLIALGLPIYCAGRRGHMVALTFDDGPGTYTQLAIDKLRKHHLRATFFVVGRNLGLIPGVTRVERRMGAVGDHTFTHPLLTQLAPAAAEQEMASTQRLLAHDSGAPVTLFRPPYGGRNATIDGLSKRLGMLEILWTVDSADSLGADYAGISRNVIAGLRPGSIILMHENRGQTIRAMLTIFPEIQRRHLQTVSVPELLAKDPPSIAQVRAGPRACTSSAGSGLGGG